MKKTTAHMRIYPLRQKEVSPGIGAALDALFQEGVDHETGMTGTLLWGDEEKVFLALKEAFSRASSVGPTTMEVTISNACPYPGKE